MKRYGDNLPSSNCQEEITSGNGTTVQVIYGGCGVRYGTFTRPVEPPRKRKSLNIFSLLKFRRKKNK